ncbi:efflux RND transporter periplasmic adaptor subunit [Pelagibius marinus]|uniref:efflux RND transporter periplasmic adaptor subunit n=1 Tax=Pelagibius marinus TaxID=2762760 RepID=UPI001872B231|nr:efflux RND transporter periplasmic adaptor subunit [Pelagibius marinus]
MIAYVRTAKRRSAVAGLVPLAAILLGLTAAALDPGPAAAQQDPSRVRVNAVRSEPLKQTVPVIGRLVARQAGSVAARIGGPILEFRVEVGDRVAAGDVLAVLDDSIMRAERDLAAAGLAVARAELKTKQAQITLAQQELARLEGLKKSAAFSQARFEDALQEVVIAQAGASEAESSVTSARAQLRLAEINLEYTQITAPYDGVITRRLSEAGSYASSGEELVNMIADQSLEVEADVPSNRLLGLSAGTTVDVTLDNGTKFKAAVRAIIPNENPLTRTRAVRFVPDFGPPDQAATAPLANEQSVTVQVPIGAPREIVSVHKDAIIKRPNDTIVFVVTDGKAQPRSIVLGEAVGSRYEVLDGLAAGDLVVVRGNERLQPGTPVQIEEAS